MVDPNNWLERRDPQNRRRDDFPYTEQDAPSGRSILIMFSAILCVLALIALFSWVWRQWKAKRDGGSLRPAVAVRQETAELTLGFAL